MKTTYEGILKYSYNIPMLGEKYIGSDGKSGFSFSGFASEWYEHRGKKVRITFEVIDEKPSR